MRACLSRALAFFLAFAPPLAAAAEASEFHGVHETLVAEKVGGPRTTRIALECAAAGCTLWKGELRETYPMQRPTNPRRLPRARAAIGKAFPEAQVRGCIDLDASNPDTAMACNFTKNPWKRPTVVIVPPPGGDLIVLWARPAL
jgi:hypothetical protein